MKKVLSVVLALVMVLATMTMLVPTASAVATGTDGGATYGAAGKVYYEQNFDAWTGSTLQDDALAEAIGWAAPGSTNTMLMDGDALRIVAQYTPTGTYPPTENKWAASYDTTLFSDTDLIRNAVVLEYTFKYNRREAVSANDLQVTKKDGSQKVVRADGQGAYQFAAIRYVGRDGQGEIYVPRINLNGNVTPTAKMYASIGGAVSSSWMNNVTRNSVTANYFAKYNTLTPGTTYSDLEYDNNPVDTNRGTYTSSIMDREYRVKTVVDPAAHYMYCFVDDVLYASVNLTSNISDNLVMNLQKADIQSVFGDTLKLHVKCGMDVTIDDIKVSEYVPHLTISEVMLNGVGLSGASGKYQWIELTNPTDAAVNVYDYGIHLCDKAWTGTAANRKLPIGGEQEIATGDAAASTLGYFTPGDKQLGDEVFTSPTYENGVLQPGESAVVLFPQTAMDGGLSVTNEAFNTYLTGLGMPAGTKTFVCSNTTGYDFVIGFSSTESTTLQVVKVTHDGAGENPVADCKDQYLALAPAFAECTAVVSNKDSSGTNYYGLTHNMVPTILTNGGKLGKVDSTKLESSVEITYTGTFQVGANLKWGFSGGQNDNAATPGTVPEAFRRAIDVDYTDANGTQSKLQGSHMTAFTYEIETPQKPGQAVQIWIDGVMVEEDVNTDTYTASIAAADMTNADHHTIEVKYLSTEPMFVGFQKSEVVNGIYSVRVLAGVTDPENFDSLGFYIRADLDGIDAKEKTVVCQYVYRSVTVTDSTGTYEVNASDYGYEYFYAIHINNIDGELYPNLYIEATVQYNGVANSDGTKTFNPATGVVS